MRQLDSCDFCGTAPEGVFEVVPASVAGDARRLALCANCRNTLQSVTDPLLDAAEPGGSASNESTAASPIENSEPDAPSHELDATPVDEVAAADADEPGDSAATEPDADRPSGGQSEDSGADSNDESAATGSASEDGVTIGAEESSQQRERKPQGYAQVVRLLQNRDGAMSREDLRALATNAYDLGGNQFEDAVDAAVENGDLQETSDGLQTE